MTGVTLGRQHSQGKRNVVAMWPHQRNSTLDLLGPPLSHPSRQGCAETCSQRTMHRAVLALLRKIEVYRRLVLRSGVVLGRSNIGVRLADMRCQVGKSRQPGLEELAARLCKMGVPDIECGSRVTEWLAISVPPTKGFQQRVALPQHPLVVGTYPGQARPARDDEVIDEAPPFTGIAFDDRDVHRRKH